MNRPAVPLLNGARARQTLIVNQHLAAMQAKANATRLWRKPS